MRILTYRIETYRGSAGVHRYFLSRKHTAPTVHSVPRYVFFVEEDVPYVLNLALRECGTITTRVEI